MVGGGCSGGSSQHVGTTMQILRAPTRASCTPTIPCGRTRVRCAGASLLAVKRGRHPPACVRQALCDCLRPLLRRTWKHRQDHGTAQVSGYERCCFASVRTCTRHPSRRLAQAGAGWKLALWGEESNPAVCFCRWQIWSMKSALHLCGQCCPRRRHNNSHVTLKSGQFLEMHITRQASVR